MQFFAVSHSAICHLTFPRENEATKRRQVQMLNRGRFSSLIKRGLAQWGILAIFGALQNPDFTQIWAQKSFLFFLHFGASFW